jgi:hypothetical protein
MDDPKIGLTFFLLKQDQVALFKGAWMSPSQEALPLAEPLEGVFLPLAPAQGEPRWGPIIRSALRPPARLNLYSQSPAGMLVLRRNGRTFVATFGHAWLSDTNSMPSERNVSSARSRCETERAKRSKRQTTTESKRRRCASVSSLSSSGRLSFAPEIPVSTYSSVRVIPRL